MVRRHSDEWTAWTPVRALAAIGDGHGHAPAYKAIIAKLHEAGLGIFEDSASLVLADDAALCFTGDYIDRGTSNLELIKIVQGIQEANPANVRALFGNHELLALASINYAAEAQHKSNPARFYAMSTVHGANGGDRFIEEFGRNPTEAFENYVRHMEYGGPIGEWMRSLDPFATYDVNGKRVLCIHAGVPHSLRHPQHFDDYCKALYEHLEIKSGVIGREAKYLENPLVGSGSPFWDRTTPKLDAQGAAEAADALGVDYIVIGHTPQDNITSYGGRIFNIDVGMTPRYGEGEPASLIIDEKGVHALYAKRGLETLVKH